MFPIKTCGVLIIIFTFDTLTISFHNNSTNLIQCFIVLLKPFNNFISAILASLNPNNPYITSALNGKPLYLSVNHFGWGSSFSLTVFFSGSFISSILIVDSTTSSPFLFLLSFRPLFLASALILFSISNFILSLTAVGITLQASWASALVAFGPIK